MRKRGEGGAASTVKRKTKSLSMIIACVIFFLLNVFVKTSNALREDQLGTYDWHLKFVGDVRFVSFLTGTKNDRNKVIATTQDSNIVARWIKKMEQ